MDDDVSVWMAALGGVSAGLVSSIVTCPLDVVKTRMQVQAGHEPTKKRHYRGPLQSLARIVREEGAHGLFRGLWPTCVGLTINWAVYFSSYNTFQHTLGDFSTVTRRGSPLNHLLSAVGAGGLTAVVTSPLWVVKTRYQTHSVKIPVHGVKRASPRGIFATIVRIVRREGPTALFKGLPVSLFGLVHVAIQFPLYEWIKARMSHDPHVVSTSTIMTATAVSKVVASCVSYPLEVVRSRQQHATEPLMAHHARRHIYQIEGVRGFYHGMVTNLIRVVPSALITFVTYEWVIRAIGRVAH